MDGAQNFERKLAESPAREAALVLSQRVHAVEADAETTAVGDLTVKGFPRPIPAFAGESVTAPAPSRS